ncbi:MAG TPA: PhnD/SsuA/transferrin family substrate-binding protein [Candidatus Binatia bacterium]|jgi:phosphonate transport system substrate-binding protein|nr:PhnD/SsuA/transferrin family substrate-binding protein [Candidatus Binatia bacterium]
MTGIESMPEKQTGAQTLLISSCMAPIADPFVQALAVYAGRRLAVATRFVDDISWQQREQWLDEGKVQVCWLCGLPYVWKADAGRATAPDVELELLAAPVMEGPRYDGRPIYFSDVVVRRDSPFRSFEQLRGASWAYNEPRSHSGYLLTRYNLALRGLNGDFFGRVVGAGSHQRALAMVLAGEIDASAIDSTVLELALAAPLQIAAQIRVLESWGPSPIPPWLAHRQAPQELRTKLRQILLEMHEDEEGRDVLRLAHVARFVLVQDKDYDPIREMARRAAHVTLGEVS